MTTGEILMTDPTTEEGRKYWAERRRIEEAEEWTYKLTANDDYEVGTFEDLEDARVHGKTLVAHGWFRYCRIYTDDEWLEDVR